MANETTGYSNGDLMETTDDSLFGGQQSPGSSSGFAPFSFAMLLRAKWIIIGVFLSVSLVAIPAIWTFVVPIYKARSQVRVSPVVSRIIFKTEDNGQVPLYRSFLRTQVSIIQSATVLQRVLDNEDVKATDWYKEAPRTIRTMLGGTPPSPLVRLRDDLSVSPVRDTELINVSMRTKKASDAKLIADAVVEAFKEVNDESYKQGDIARYETLVQEKKALQREIEDLLDRKFSRANELGTTDPEGLRSQMATHLSVLESQYEDAKRQLAMMEWEMESLSGDGDEGPHESAEPGDTVSAPEAQELEALFGSDSEWRSLKSAVNDVHHRLDLARQRYGDSHPQIRELLASVEYAEGKLEDRENELASGWTVSASGETVPDSPAFPAARTKWLISRQKKELNLLEDGILVQKEKVDQASAIARQISSYEEELSHKRELYEAVRSRLQVLDMENKAPGRIRIESAVVPAEPEKDRRVLLTLMALAGGLMGGIALAFLLVSLDPTVHEAEDVQHTVRLPFLGQVPITAGRNEDPAQDSGFVESMRMIRTALLERMRTSGERAVLITSSMGEAGKSTVAIGLANSMAKLGKKTLLIEADLRKPSLAGRLDAEPRFGLADLLTKNATDAEAVVPGPTAGLDVVFAGNVGDEFDAERLANGEFGACMSRWRREYDCIILDAPPVLPVADARILSSHADGVVMVLRSSHCKRGDVVRAYADLGVAGARLLGTVLLGGSGTGYGYQVGYGRSDTHGKADVRRALPNSSESTR